MKVLDAKTIDAKMKKQLETLIEKMDNGDFEPSDFERSFLNDFKEKLEKWGDKTFLSDKQKAVVEKMAEKHGCD